MFDLAPVRGKKFSILFLPVDYVGGDKACDFFVGALFFLY